MLTTRLANILCSQDPLPSNHSVSQWQPPHPASHLSLHTIPLDQPSHSLPASLPASPAKLPCQPMLHSHVGMVYVERDQGHPHPPAAVQRGWVRQRVIKKSTSPPNILHVPHPNILYSPLNILCKSGPQCQPPSGNT